jgi:hypothetical protein
VADVTTVIDIFGQKIVGSTVAFKPMYSLNFDFPLSSAEAVAAACLS